MKLTKHDIKHLIGIFAGCLIITGLLIAGAMDEENARLIDENYCDMVRGGHWPDYKENFSDKCGGEKIAYRPGI